jgi:hypothetical protein
VVVVERGATFGRKRCVGNGWGVGADYELELPGKAKRLTHGRPSAAHRRWAARCWAFVRLPCRYLG